MNTMDLTKTMGFEVLRRDGAKACQRTFLSSPGMSMIDTNIQQDLNQLLSEMAKGIHLGGGKMVETSGLVRLTGYLQELASVAGMMPAFGFRFELNELGKLAVIFDPKRLDPSLGSPGGLERAGQ